MALNSEAMAAMTTVIGALNSELMQARVQVASTWFVLGSRESAESALDTAAKQLDYLAGEGRSGVLSGAVGTTSWRDLASECHNLIASVTGYAGKWSASESLARVVVDTGSAIASGAKDASTTLRFVAVAAAAIVALILFREVKGLAT